MNEKRKTVLDMVSEEEWQTMDVKNEDPNVCQSEAPERIWAVEGLTEVLSFNVYDNGGTEYTRADLVQSQIDAAVAAAYGDAASLCVILKSFPQLKEIGSTIHADLADDIRASTDTDALAAQVRAEALREAAYWCNQFAERELTAAPKEYGDGYADGAGRCADAILALIPDTDT